MTTCVDSQDPNRSVTVQSLSEKGRQCRGWITVTGRRLRTGLNVHLRIHSSYVLTYILCPSPQVEKGIERVDPASHSPNLILQDSGVAVFSGRGKAMVMRARVSGGRIRVDVHVGTLRMQPGCRVWSLSCSPYDACDCENHCFAVAQARIRSGGWV